MNDILRAYLLLVFLLVFCWVLLYSQNSLAIVANGPILNNGTAITKTTRQLPRAVVVTSPTGRNTSLLRPNDHFVVPNIVHFIWFGRNKPMLFHHMLSVLSAHRLLKPDAIWFHCDHVPVGAYWNYITKNLSVPLNIIKRVPPTYIFFKRLYRPEHQADVARIEILLKHGGIYLDTDVISLRSFDPLRLFNMTMGLEYHGKPGRLNNGILVARPNATFLHIWKSTYRNFTGREWDYHSCQLTYKLQFMYPELIHVEERTLNYPGGNRIKLIYGTVYDWSKNYAIHLWHRLHKKLDTPQTIRKMNTTFGQIARYVYYGSPKLLD